MCGIGDVARMSVENMNVDSVNGVDLEASECQCACEEIKGREALSAFWAEHRLKHLETILRLYLGTESMTDLDDVLPGDLRTLRSQQWAEAQLTVAEINRLHRAVAVHHAKKHPQPEPGVEHLPRCKKCACQNAGDVSETHAEPAYLLRRSSGCVVEAVDEKFAFARASGI